MLKITIPDSAHSSQTISIGAREVDLVFRWNTIASQWIVDITIDDVDYLKGVVLAPNRFTTEQYTLLTAEIGGQFACANITDRASLPLTRSSFADGDFIFGFEEV